MARVVRAEEILLWGRYAQDFLKTFNGGDLMGTPVSTLGFGLDSLLASLALGFGKLSWRERLRLAAAFGGCDVAATLLGTVRPHHLPHPPALVVYFLCALLAGRAARSSRALLYALPALLSIDNLFGGAPASLALLLGAGSATMSMCGFLLASVSRRLLRGGGGLASARTWLTEIIRIHPRPDRFVHNHARRPWA
jgi:hypothetical protein